MINQKELEIVNNKKQKINEAKAIIKILKKNSKLFMYSHDEIFKDKHSTSVRRFNYRTTILIKTIINPRRMDRGIRKLLIDYYKKKINTLTKEIQEMIEGN